MKECDLITFIIEHYGANPEKAVDLLEKHNIREKLDDLSTQVEQIFAEDDSWRDEDEIDY